MNDHTVRDKQDADMDRLPATVENHPLVPVHGVFRDDPTWDDYMRSIEEYRQFINDLENN